MKFEPREFEIGDIPSVDLNFWLQRRVPSAVWIRHGHWMNFSIVVVESLRPPTSSLSWEPADMFSLIGQ